MFVLLESPDAMAQTSTQPPKLTNILVATDFSSASEIALLYGISIARRYDATLILAHMVRPDTIRRSDEAARSAMDEAWREGQRLETDLLIRGGLRGVKHKLVIEQGEIWEGLDDIARRHDVQMLVVGTRGRTGLAKVLLGSVAERTFRLASCPVLTVGPNSRQPVEQSQGPSRVLYATDFTPQSLYAADYAVSLAQHYAAKLTLLHVIPEGTASDAAVAQSRSRLQEILPAASDSKIEAELEVRSGNAAAGILALAAERQPELIVLGVTHPGGVAFAGRRWSVASEVAAQASCPVLTVRGPSAV